MFSVVMPVWNRSNVVGRAIKSVLAQTCKDFELIVIDDGSDDAINDVVSPFLSDKVKYYRTEHRGVSAARNLGVRKAAGELIAYLDSDNVWHSGFLARMKENLLKRRLRRGLLSCKTLCKRTRRKDSGSRHCGPGVLFQGTPGT